jgi:hypothetical protein
MSKEIENAIEVLKQAMIDDGPSELGSYAHAWHCNIAMACYDAIEDAKLDINSKSKELDSHYIGNDAASRFMKLLFNIETTNGSVKKTEIA